MNNFRAYLLLICAIGLNFSASAKAPIARGKTAIVMIDRSPSGFVETVNFKVPEKGMFESLINLHKERPNYIAILVHEDVSLKRILELKGILEKANWPYVKIFYFDKKKTYLQELSYSGVYVYSENVDVLVPIHSR